MEERGQNQRPLLVESLRWWEERERRRSRRGRRRRCCLRGASRRRRGRRRVEQWRGGREDRLTASWGER